MNKITMCGIFQTLENYYSNYRKDETDFIKKSEIKAKELIELINDEAESMREECDKRIREFIKKAINDADGEIKSYIRIERGKGSVSYRMPERLAAIVSEIEDERSQLVNKSAAEILTEFERNMSVLDKYRK